MSFSTLTAIYHSLQCKLKEVRVRVSNVFLIHSKGLNLATDFGNSKKETPSHETLRDATTFLITEITRKMFSFEKNLHFSKSLAIKQRKSDVFLETVVSSVVATAKHQNKGAR